MKTVNRKPVALETDQQKRDREIVESIARNIGSLSRAVASLLVGPLKKRALVILLATSSGQPQRTVDSVLTALAGMEKEWLQ